MENKLKILQPLCIFILLGVFVAQFYNGIILPPGDGDSSIYHIPIAQSFINGQIFNPPSTHFDLLYYPASANALLVPFILLSVPLNLYNVIGWTALVFALYFLGKKVGLSTTSSIIFTTGFSTVVSIVRLMNTQSIDLYLTLFYVLSLILIFSRRFSTWTLLMLGVTLGMIVGSKFSGPILVLIFILVFSKTILTKINIKNAVIFAIPVLLLGGVWYLRNYLLQGNPFYPGKFLGLPSNPNFYLQDWTPLKTLTNSFNGLVIFFNALLTEYFLVGILSVIVTMIILKSKNISNSFIYKLVLLGSVNFLIYLFLPSWPENIVSDLRYSHVAFLCLFLASFLYLEKRKEFSLFTTLVVLHSAFVFSYIGHKPKVILFSLILFIPIYLILKKKNFEFV